MEISKELLSEIHAQFRRQMNADITDTLRRHGVVYRLAFGVPSMRLKEVASRYTPSVDLAETLWAEDIRESKMLATRLYPLEAMTPAIANRWVDEIPYAEIADQTCMNLFARLPFAPSLATTWLNADAEQHPMTIYCALKLITRLDAVIWSNPTSILANDSLSDLDSLLHRIEDIELSTKDLQLRTAAYWAKENLQQSQGEVEI